MPTLAELQSDFASAVFSGDSTVLRWIEGGTLSADERLAVYRRDVFHNLGEALRDVYPVVQRLVGEDFFAAAARRFARTFPSTGGNLHGFGGEFPDFLAGFAPAAGLPYLADTARLEWLVHLVFHAADANPFDFAPLTGITAEGYDRLCFDVAPTCRLLASPYPVHRIWAANQPENSDAAAVDLAVGAVRLAVRRTGFAIALDPLGPGEYALLAAFSAGESLGAAATRALAAEPGFALGAALQRALQGGMIAGCRSGPG